MVTIDRATASRLGITPQMIDDTLYDAYGQRQVSTIFTQLNQYRVVLEVKPEFQQKPEDLKTSTSAAPAGGKVPLSAIAEITETDGAAGHRPPGAVSLHHPVVQPGAGGFPGGGGAGHRGHHARSWACRPASRGASRARPWPSRRSLANEPLLILAALITVYIVLGVLYESYIHPITILSTLPSAGVGAILALLICRTDFSVIALIGIILLIGIVKKNGIMMVDFALDAERKEGKTPEEAIYQACLLRFRPIMMTTMAALLGALPLAIGTGDGFGTAPSPGHLHHRRPDLQPGAHPLHHPGHLSLVRPAGPAACARRPRKQRPWGPLDGTGMNFSALFINRPVATTLLTIGMALAGVLAFRLLAGVAPAPGGFPDHPGERRRCPGPSPRPWPPRWPRPWSASSGASPGVTEMTSSSYRGSTGITLQFDLNRNINGAARDVQAAINAARSYLPANLPSNPTYRKVNPADAPILILALTSDTAEPGEMYDAASTILQQKLSQVEGVGRYSWGAGRCRRCGWN